MDCFLWDDFSEGALVYSLVDWPNLNTCQSFFQDKGLRKLLTSSINAKLYIKHDDL